MVISHVHRLQKERRNNKFKPYCEHRLTAEISTSLE